MRSKAVIFVCALAWASAIGGVRAATQETDVLGRSLGTVSFPVSCKPQAAKHIERGVAAMHHMMYSSARELFEQASKADPDCAMAPWGIAMTYIHPLWSDRPSPEVIEKGAALAAKAAKLGGKSGRERAYIDTVKVYFVDGAANSEEERLKLFDEAWAKVVRASEGDNEALAFHALAHLSTASPNDKTYVVQNRAAAIAQQVLDAVPDHPGAHHYMIHACDYPQLARRALPIAREYGKIAPDVSHALHMMSHIFTRLGLWRESVELNAKAAAAALKVSGELGAVSVHYPHALDYKGYAHLQLAQDAEAREALEKLAALKPPFHSINQNAMAYAFAAMPARYALERRAWGEAARLAPQTPRDFPWSEDQEEFVAITHFARALGHAHEKRFDEAKAEAATLEAIGARVAKRNAYWAKQVEIERLAAQGWTAYLAGETAQGLAAMKQAADLEATTEKSAVSPGEVLPAAELYGDMLLAEKQYGEAAAAYETALARSPRRFNSLYGVARAHELAGDEATARRRYAELIEMCADAPSSRDRLASARGFLKSN